MSLVCVIGAPNARAQSSPVNSQTVQPHPVNLDFEQGTLGQVPDAWLLTTINYGAELMAEQPKSGKYAAVLHSKEGASSGSKFRKPDASNRRHAFPRQTRAFPRIRASGIRAGPVVDAR
jgi:hypothetical protein